MMLSDKRFTTSIAARLMKGRRKKSFDSVSACVCEMKRVCGGSIGARSQHKEGHSR